MPLLHLVWDPDPIAFSAGFVHVRWYGLSWAFSLLCLYALGIWIFRRENRSDEHVVTIVQYVFLGAFLGARIAQVIFYNPDYFLQNPSQILAIWNGGLASHGGVIGGIIGMVLFSRAYPQYGLLWLLDRLFVVGLLCAAIIRLGNFFNAELPGTVSDVPWAIIEPRYGMEPRHPVVLYEFLVAFAMFLCEILLYLRYRSKYPGLYLCFFLTVPYVLRFLVEFFKEPEAGVWFGFISGTQMLHVPLILSGVVLSYFVFTRKLKY